MAFVLALHGRGFAEIGTRGMRAGEIVRADDVRLGTLDDQMEINQETEESLEKLESALEGITKRLEAQEGRQNIPKEELI